MDDANDGLDSTTSNDADDLQSEDPNANQIMDDNT